MNNRKNDFVNKVLQKLCSQRDGSGPADQTDGQRGWSREKILLEKAVLFATLNDDHETLGGILEWGKDNNVALGWTKDQCSGNGHHCPILYACLRNYTKCISVLYKYGYEVILHKDDKDIIDKILKGESDFAKNDYHFYMKIWVGDRHVDQFYRLDCLDLIKSKGRKEDSDTDPVERFLRIKAYANPHYIETEFM